MKRLIRKWCCAMGAVLGLLVAGSAAHGEETLKPYVLVSNEPGDPQQVIQQVRDALSGAGFAIAGQYAPYPGAHVVVVTNGVLRGAAARSEMGGFGAIQRVAVTEHADKVQVAYTNPVYMANVYRMESDLMDVATALQQALGSGTSYGAEGLTAEELREYHYKIFMPYFDEPYELGEFDSHAAALEAVEQGLETGYGGVSKVYRVDLEGKDESVFGVHLTRECSGDQYIMEKIDFKDIKSTPHLPYEVLVSGSKVYALHAKFRIAQSFPDLGMIGSNSFFSIMCAPDDIEAALTAVVKHRQPQDEASW